MAGGIPTLYTSAVQEFHNGTQDWDTDNHYAVLVTSSYSPLASHSTYADVSATQIAAAGKIDMGGEAVNNVGGNVQLAANGVDFNVGTYTAKYIVILQGTAAGSSSTDRLVGYGELNVGGTLSTSSTGLYVSWDGGVVFDNVPTVGYNPIGLTEDQYTNQSLFCCLIAGPDLVHERVSASPADNITLRQDQTIANGDTVYQWIDSGPNGLVVLERTNTLGPLWLDPAADATYALDFDSTTGAYFGNSTTYNNFLHDGTTGYTILMRLSISEAISTNTGTLLASYSGLPATGIIFRYNNGDLEFFVQVSTTAVSDAYTWSGFSANTTYTLMVTMSSGGSYSLFIDDLGTPVATHSFTNLGAGTADQDLKIGYRDSGQSGNFELQGLVICKQVLTEAEGNAFVTLIDNIASA